MQRVLRQFAKRNYASDANTTQVCVVGSGPAGFYTSKYLLNQFAKQGKKIHISMLEKLPTPYGLVRYGVAPDHPEVKSVTNDFDNVASQTDKFSFFGNVSLGSDVTIDELKNQFHAVVLCYGAEGERKLHIAGEDSITGIESARQFVNWYNGLPDFKKNQTNSWFEKATTKYTQMLQSSKRAVIIGQGNVAIDVARILAKPIQELSKYDTTDYALQALQHHTIRDILVTGRRGPVQAACTTKELRELGKIDGCSFTVPQNELILDTLSMQEMEKAGRVKKRMFEVLQAASKLQHDPSKNARHVELLFYRNPVEFKSDAQNRLCAVRFEKTKLVGEPDNIKAVGTGQFEEIECQVAFRSIGYKSAALPGIPFDHSKAIVPNLLGRVVEHGAQVPGLYVCGWLKRGPVGVILSNVVDAQETVECIVQDVHQSDTQVVKAGHVGLQQMFASKNVNFVTFGQYKKIERHELEQGKQKGKLREKVHFIDDMLDIAAK